MYGIVVNPSKGSTISISHLISNSKSPNQTINRTVPTPPKPKLACLLRFLPPSSPTPFDWLIEVCVQSSEQMGSSDEKVVAVIMVGGPTKGLFLAFHFFWLPPYFFLKNSFRSVSSFCLITVQYEHAVLVGILHFGFLTNFCRNSISATFFQYSKTPLPIGRSAYGSPSNFCM